MNDENLVIVLTTMPDDDRAEVLAATLVEERLAACVNVHAPVRSVYRWHGRVEREAERQLVIKTVRSRLDTLEARVRSVHPYELPEWIVVAADQVSAEYLRWGQDATADASGTR